LNDNSNLVKAFWHLTLFFAFVFGDILCDRYSVHKEELKDWLFLSAMPAQVHDILLENYLLT